MLLQALHMSAQIVAAAADDQRSRPIAAAKVIFLAVYALAFQLVPAAATQQCSRTAAAPVVVMVACLQFLPSAC